MPILNYTTSVDPHKTMGEIWKPAPVAGYSDIYSVSNRGRVRRDVASGSYPAGFILTSRDNGHGYLHLRLRKPGGAMKWMTIHKLVALAFLPAPTGDAAVVNHKDGNKRNNNPENLEWVSYGENRRHAVRIGLDCRKGESHPMARLTENQVCEIRERKEGGESMASIAKDFGLHVEYVRLIVNRKRWAHLPYTR